MDTAVQLLGAFLLLGAFGMTQTGRLSPQAPAYQGANLAGSGILATSAFVNEQWGFVLLNVCWALIALLGLARHRRS
jgi:hypothetical protein